MMARCSFCGWRFDGEPSEALAAQHAHMQNKHPDVLQRAEDRLTPQQRYAKETHKRRAVLHAAADVQRLERDRSRDAERAANAAKIVAAARANPSWTVGQLQRNVGFSVPVIRAALQEAGLPVLRSSSR